MCETKNITNGIRKSCLQNVWMPAHGRLQRHITASSIVRVIFCIIMALLSGQIVAYANQIACEARLDFTWMVTRDGLRYGVMLLVFFEIMYHVYRLWSSRLARTSVTSPTTGIPICSSAIRYTGFRWSTLRTLLSGIFLLLAWSPYIYWYYPGTLWYDTGDQILQFFGYQVLDSSGQYITTHHPLFDTLLFGWFAQIGSALFNSKALGLALLIGIQIMVGAFELSYAVEWFRSHGTGCIARALLLLFFAFFPFFPTFYCGLVKDSVHALFLVPWLLMYFDVALTHGTALSRPWPAILFGLLSIGNALTTATGMYITALSLLAAMFFVPGRVRRIGCTIASAVLVVFCQLVFPAVIPTPYPVQKSDAHQMFILPMQMTARYSSQFHDDVTSTERIAIDGFNMVSFDEMPQQYNPYLADPIIHLKLGDPSYQNQYVRAWISMGLRHPDSYLQAFLCMESGWFATRKSSEPDPSQYMSDTWLHIHDKVEAHSLEYSYQHRTPTYMNFTTETAIPGYVSVNMPDFETHTVRNSAAIDKAIDMFKELPVANTLMVQSMWTFILPMMMLYATIRGSKFTKMFWLFAPMMLTLLSLIPSGISLPLKPTGSRYMFMLVIIVPIMMMLMLSTFARDNIGNRAADFGDMIRDGSVTRTSVKSKLPHDINQSATN